jgi:YaiO family outer membrane protein
MANSLQNGPVMIGRSTCVVLACLGLQLFWAVQATAQSGTLTVELSGNVQSLSGPYGDGGGLGLRAAWVRDRNVWSAFGNHERRFGASGLIGGMANTHTFSPDWYAYAAAAASTEAFFLPRYRLDGQIARKLGGHRQWVVATSLTAAAAHDEHRDLGAGIGVIRYFESGFILDGAVNWNRSRPGDLTSRRQTLTATYARAMRHSISGRVSWGREAYQLTSAATSITGFSSHELSLRYQRWLVSNSGATISAEYYDNPHYQRTGLYLTVFRQFGQ